MLYAEIDLEMITEAQGGSVGKELLDISTNIRRVRQSKKPDWKNAMGALIMLASFKLFVEKSTSMDNDRRLTKKLIGWGTNSSAEKILKTVVTTKQAQKKVNELFGRSLLGKLTVNEELLSKWMQTIKRYFIHWEEELTPDVQADSKKKHRKKIKDAEERGKAISRRLRGMALKIPAYD